MEWFLGVLIIVGFAVDIVLYILDRGGFIRVSTNLENLAVDVKNLGEKVGELTGRVDVIEANQKTLSETISGVDTTLAETTSQLETRVGSLYESHADLDRELTALLNANIEHPVLVEPVKKNVGGRPPKKVGP